MHIEMEIRVERCTPSEACGLLMLDGTAVFWTLEGAKPGAAGPYLSFQAADHRQDGLVQANLAFFTGRILAALLAHRARAGAV
jgi:hypothetical protein